MIVYQVGECGFDGYNHVYSVKQRLGKPKIFRCRVKHCNTRIQVSPTQTEIIGTHNHLPRPFIKYFLECLRSKQDKQALFQNFDELFKYLKKQCNSISEVNCLSSSKAWLERCWGNEKERLLFFTKNDKPPPILLSTGDSSCPIQKNPIPSPVILSTGNSSGHIQKISIGKNKPPGNLEDTRMIIYQVGDSGFDGYNYIYTVNERLDKTKNFRCRFKSCNAKIRITPTQTEIINTHNHLPRPFIKYFLECLRPKQDKQVLFQNFEELFNSLQKYCNSISDDHCLASSKVWLERCWQNKKELILFAADVKPLLSTGNSSCLIQKNPIPPPITGNSSCHIKKNPIGENTHIKPRIKHSNNNSPSRNRELDERFQQRLEELLNQKAYNLYKVYSQLCDEFGSDICNDRYRQTFISLAKIKAANKDLPFEDDGSTTIHEILKSRTLNKGDIEDIQHAVSMSGSNLQKAVKEYSRLESSDSRGYQKNENHKPKIKDIKNFGSTARSRSSTKDNHNKSECNNSSTPETYKPNSNKPRSASCSRNSSKKYSQKLDYEKPKTKNIWNTVSSSKSISRTKKSNRVLYWDDETESESDSSVELKNHIQETKDSINFDNNSKVGSRTRRFQNTEQDLEISEGNLTIESSPENIKSKRRTKEKNSSQNIEEAKFLIIERWKQILKESEEPFLKQFGILESEYGETLCKKARPMCQELWKLYQGAGTRVEKRNSQPIRYNSRVTAVEFKNKALSLISGSKITLLSLSDSLKKEFGLIAWKKYNDIAESLWTKERYQPKKTKDEKVKVPETFQNELRNILAGPKISYDQVVKKLLTKVDGNEYKKYQDLAKSMWKVSQSLDSDTNDSSGQSEDIDIDSDQDDSRCSDVSDESWCPSDNGADKQSIDNFDYNLPEVQRKLYEILSEKHVPFKVLFKMLEDRFGKKICQKYEKLCYLWWEQEDLNYYDQDAIINSAIDEMEDDLKCLSASEEDNMSSSNHKPVKIKNKKGKDHEKRNCPPSHSLKSDTKKIESTTLKQLKVTEDPNQKNTDNRKTEKNKESRGNKKQENLKDPGLSEKVDRSDLSEQVDKMAYSYTSKTKVDSKVNNNKDKKNMKQRKSNRFYDENMHDLSNSDNIVNIKENDRSFKNKTTNTYQQKFQSFYHNRVSDLSDPLYELKQIFPEKPKKKDEIDHDQSEEEESKETKHDLDGGDMSDISDFLSKSDFNRRKKSETLKHRKPKSMPRTSTRIVEDDKSSDMSDLFLSDDSETNEGYRSKLSKSKMPIRKRKAKEQIQSTIQKQPKIEKDIQNEERHKEIKNAIDTISKNKETFKRLFLNNKKGALKRKSNVEKEKQQENKPALFFDGDIEEQVAKNIVLKPRPKTVLEDVSASKKVKKRKTNIVEVTKENGDKIVKQVTINKSPKKNTQVQENSTEQDIFNEVLSGPVPVTLDKPITYTAEQKSQDSPDSDEEKHTVEKVDNADVHQRISHKKHNIVLKDKSILKWQELLRNKSNVQVKCVPQSTAKRQDILENVNRHMQTKRNIITGSLNKVSSCKEAENKSSKRRHRLIKSKRSSKKLETFSGKAASKDNESTDKQDDRPSSLPSLEEKSEQDEIKEIPCKKIVEVDKDVSAKDQLSQFLFPTRAKSVSLEEVYSFLIKQDREENFDMASDTETMVFDQFVSNINCPNYCCLTFVSPSVIEIVKGLPYEELHLQIDCSFKISPKCGETIFLVMINALARGACFPLLWSLATAANQRCFILILLQLKTIIPKVNSIIVDISDYSENLKNAIRIVYPNVELRGYWFYFARSLYLKADSLGLISEEDTIALNIVRRATAISLLPLDQMEKGIQVLTTYILEKSYTKPAVLGFLHYLSELSSTYTKNFKDYMRQYDARLIFKSNVVEFAAKDHSNTWFCVQDLLKLESIDYSQIKMGTDSLIEKSCRELLNKGNIKGFMEKKAETLFSNVRSILVETNYTSTSANKMKEESSLNLVTITDTSNAKTNIKHTEPEASEKLMPDQPEKDKKPLNETNDSGSKISLNRSNESASLSSSIRETRTKDRQLTSTNVTAKSNLENVLKMKSVNSTKQNQIPTSAIVKTEGNKSKLSDKLNTPLRTNKSAGSRAIDLHQIFKSSQESSDTFRSLQRKNDSRQLSRNVAIIAPNNDLMTGSSQPLHPNQNTGIFKDSNVSQPKKSDEGLPPYKNVANIIKSLGNSGVSVQKLTNSFDLKVNESDNGNVIEFVEEDEYLSDDNNLEYENEDAEYYDKTMKSEEDDVKNYDENEYEHYECLEEVTNEIAEDLEDDDNIEYQYYESLDTYLTNDDGDESNVVNSTAYSEKEIENEYEYESEPKYIHSDIEDVRLEFNQEDTYEVDDTANYIQIEEVNESGYSVVTYLPKKVQKPNITTPQLVAVSRKVATVAEGSSSTSQVQANPKIGYSAITYLPKNVQKLNINLPQKVPVPKKVTTVVEELSSTSEKQPNPKKVSPHTNQKYLILQNKNIQKLDKIKILNQTVLGTNDPKFALKRGPDQEIQICGVVNQGQPIDHDNLSSNIIPSVNRTELTKTYDTADLLGVLEGGNINISEDEGDTGKMEVLQVLNDTDASILSGGGSEEFSLITFGENVPRVVLERDSTQKLNVCGLLSNDAFISPGTNEFQDQLELILTTEKAKQLLSN